MSEPKAKKPFFKPEDFAPNFHEANDGWCPRPEDRSYMCKKANAKAAPLLEAIEVMRTALTLCAILEKHSVIRPATLALSRVDEILKVKDFTLPGEGK